MHACSHPADNCQTLFPARDYISGESFRVAHCGQCGQVVTLPVPAEMGRYYPGGYYGDAGGRRFPALMEWLQRQLYDRRAQKVLRRLKRREARVLDVGCGRGWLLRAFQRNGCEVTGTEFSDAACRFAREVLKLPVRVGLLPELNFPDESFDVVVMWHVLEHISDPRPTLVEVSRILRPGGIFLVGVPNFGSPEARLTKAGWFHLDVPRHLSHHTRASLTQILGDAGLQVAWSSHLAPEYDCFSFVQSGLNRLGIRSNLLYNWLRGQSAKVIGGRRNVGPVLATVFLAPLLGVISLPATLVLGALGRGATVTCGAVKKESTGRQ
jgi:SAM-dependent methyltransferase